MDKKLVIIGAGWLGEALAQEALAQGWQVEATHREQGTQAHERQFALQEDGSQVHNVSLTDAYWVCAMSPGARRQPSNYQQSLEHALALYQQLNGKGFVLCSSTGIYDQQSGQYDERSALSLATARQQRLAQAEQTTLAAGAKVLRLGGLVGPNREPGRFVAGKTLSSHPEDKVNMVHRDDVIAGILTLIQHYPQAQPIYNLVHPSHPSKQNYYQVHCQRRGTQVPQFSAEQPVARVINGGAIEELGFTYGHDI
ncbi:NADP-binding protein [Pseudoalteromonas sp. BDTF-M6]|uniref:NADP-binding protein n=1 Tax=Pseudoalteromonas sp. BDTF-M6 TaxID=2796132 RepID=UPI001BB0971A|nr:NADP-binding protein [Pseudoalteromonas sp. BDTF-M6]MBS3799129.1 NADP-binding protein [Pseudoalteromonas sp. BDTF-M6]